MTSDSPELVAVARAAYETSNIGFGWPGWEALCSDDRTAWIAIMRAAIAAVLREPSEEVVWAALASHEHLTRGAVDRVIAAIADHILGPERAE